MSMSRLYERKLFSRCPAVKDDWRTALIPELPPNCLVKQLTRDEMDERQKKGLCFNCDEPFVCTHQYKKLFWIDLEEPKDAGDTFSDVQDLELPLQISLYAITGIRYLQSMRLLGNWNDGKVLVLIDYGSTHSFVSTSKVGELNAEVNEKNGLKVNVANKEQISSPGIYKGMQILLGSSNSFVTRSKASCRSVI